MTMLFLMFYGFNEYNGISKKIRYQIDALKKNGIDVRTCYYDVNKEGHCQWLVDGEVIADLGTGTVAKLKKRISFGAIVDYVEKNGIDWVYIRTYHNANPFTIHFAKRLKKLGVKLLLEIPTYPYDQEYTGKIRLPLQTDRLFRRQLAKQMERVVTFSNDDTIFGCPTIRISNGIDFSQIPLRREHHDISKELHLIAVAEIHFWHGFDRLLTGLGEYYQSNPDYRVICHIVGEPFGERERGEITSPIERYGIQEYVKLHGRLFGDELNSVFEQSDFAVGSLARHRSGVYNMKSLKNREYAARGFGFIYSEDDDDFDRQPYVLKAPADESPINIPELIAFCQQQQMPPSAIRASISSLSWEEQMKSIVRYISKE